MWKGSSVNVKRMICPKEPKTFSATNLSVGLRQCSSGILGCNFQIRHRRESTHLVSCSSEEAWQHGSMDEMRQKSHR